MSRYLRSAAVAVAVVVFALATQMALGRSMTLFSEVTGTVTRGGNPVAGAEVTRSWKWYWNSTQGSRTVVTDEAGRFSFEAEKASSFMASLVPHEPVIEQTIEVTAEGGTLLAYSYSKHSYDDGGEFPGRRLALRCELDSPVTFHLVDDKYKLGYEGFCTLDD